MTMVTTKTLFKFVALFVICLIMADPARALSFEVIGSPTVTLPGTEGPVSLTGLTMQYDEPDFIGVNTTVDAYLGVPYAEPPLGALRFSDPVWYTHDGDYDATEDRDACLQDKFIYHIPDSPPIEGRRTDEDCLYLSIYTPSPKPSSPVPVLVWIHGGGYLIGSGQSAAFDGTPIVAMSEIIVVAVNYRLGVFGSFTTGDEVATGNYGMMDQIMALKWIQGNIAAFGGDPSRVTIAGQSAGGASVGLQMLSPLSQGLFHQAIMQSGNAVCPFAWTTMDEARASHRAFAESLECSTSDSQVMVDCLRQLNAEVLLERQNSGEGYVSPPVIDGDFLLDKPVELLKRGQIKTLPTLIGSTEDENANTAMYRYFPESLYERPTMNISALRAVLPISMWYVKNPVELYAVEHHYIDWTIADNATADQLENYIRIGTDQTFACPTEYFARDLEAVGATVYRYEMTHDPSWSVYGGIPTWMGAAHGEDLQYVFAWGLSPSLSGFADQTDDEKSMSVEFMRYWTNFVKSGNPNEPKTSSSFPMWPTYTVPEQEYKKLSVDMTNGRAMRAADCAFWNRFWPSLHFQEAPMGEVYADWQDHYERWRDTDIPEWTKEFDNYKTDNSCPAV